RRHRTRRARRTCRREPRERSREASLSTPAAGNDLKLDSSETLIVSECAAIREAHCCVSDVAQPASMGYSRRVGVAFIGLEFDDSQSLFGLNQFQTEKLADGRGKVLNLRECLFLSLQIRGRVKAIRFVRHSSPPASVSNAPEFSSSSCCSLLSGNPFPDIGWAMEEFSSFLLTPAQEADHVHVHQRHFVQIQHDPGSGALHLLPHCLKVLHLQVATQPKSRGLAVRL